MSEREPAERHKTTIFSQCPRQHPWRDLIFPQVPASHLLEKYVVASPQGSPTRKDASLFSRSSSV